MLKLIEVAVRLNCSLSNVYALVQSGRLPAVATGANGKGYRVREEDFQAFIDEGRKGRRSPPLPAKENPRPQGRLFKHLDGERLRAAWQRQGVLADLTGEGNVPSSESSCDP
jgi:excisionase family DNA binding protein